MLNEVLSRLSAVGRVGTLLWWQRLVRKTVKHRSQIPRAAEAVTKAWLTDVLCREIPGAEVTDFLVNTASDGTTSRRSFQLTYNEPGTLAGLPSALFAKTTPSLTTRLIAASGTGPNEVGFYTDLRPNITIEVPRPLFAGYDSVSCNAFILLEDMVASKGVTFTDVRTEIDRATAESMVALLATMHGEFWNSGRLSSLPWLQTALTQQQSYNSSIAFKERSLVGIDRASSVIPASVMATKDALWPAYMKSLELCQTQPVTLTHSDVHLGNWYKKPDGHMGLSDWQALCVGSWASDFAYALFGALTVENRRDWEEDLLKLYLEKLSNYTKPPEFETAWLQYRQQTLHGFFFWVYTIGAGALEPNMQPDEFSLINIGRMAQGIADLDTLNALG